MDFQRTAKLSTRHFWATHPGKLLLLLVLGISFSISSFSALSLGHLGGWEVKQVSAEELYQRLGDKSEEISKNQALHLLWELVNGERKKEGVPELGWDRIGEQVAEAQAREMAQFRFLSHLNLAGESPYLRYSQAGGTDVISENLSYWESDLRVYLTPKLVWDIHERWMASPAHRQNILQPSHTSVGMAIVLRWDAKEKVMVVTAAQEFITQVGKFQRLPVEANAHTKLQLRGTLPRKANWKFRAIAIGYEPPPQPQQPEKLNATLASFSLPSPQVVLLPPTTGNTKISMLKALSWENLTLSADGKQVNSNFSLHDINISLRRLYQKHPEVTPAGTNLLGTLSRPPAGLYYMMVWVETDSTSKKETSSLQLASVQVVKVN